MASARKEPLTVGPQTTSPPAAQQGSVEEALERLHLKTPGRHNSYSDSTDGDEEVEEAFSASAAEHGRHMWERSVYHTPSSNLGLGRYDSTGNLDDTVQSAFYSPNISMTRIDLSKRYRTNQTKIVCMPAVSAQHLKLNLSTSVSDRDPSFPEGADQVVNPMVSSPTSPSPDPLPPPLPLPLNLTMSGNNQDMEDFVPV